MRCLPGLRDKMAGAFAAFVVRIQEDYPEVVKDSLALLLRWVNVESSWLNCWLTGWGRSASVCVCSPSLTNSCTRPSRSPYCVSVAAACCGSGSGWRCRNGRLRSRARRRSRWRASIAYTAWRALL
jgi:hypothetical protein